MMQQGESNGKAIREAAMRGTENSRKDAGYEHIVQGEVLLANCLRS
jgi:hypothetical protein